MTNRLLILVVEDSDLLRDATATALGMAGYAVVTASNGMEALETIDKRRPSAMLLDVRMPVLDGFGVGRALEERGIDIPIVLMTANEQVKEWAAQIGAQGFLRKPFSTLDLIQAIEALDLGEDGGADRGRRAA